MSDRAPRLKKRALNSAKGRDLIDVLGPELADTLVDVILEDGKIKPGIAQGTFTEDQLHAAVENYLDIELNNIARTGQTLSKLASGLAGGRLAPIARANLMTPKAYGGSPEASETMNAARWVCNASMTVKREHLRVTPTQHVIHMAVAAGTPMNTLSGIDAVNQLLVGQGGSTTARGPQPASPTPSSVGGRRLFEVAMRFVAARPPGGSGGTWQDFACYLLGAVIACHGYTDANGRTGRALYAICWIRSGEPFKAISAAGEGQLHGLG
jgi:hypothetical protein